MMSMNVSRKPTSADGFWVEVKPLITSELKPGSFAPVLESLFNSGKPFRFLAVDVEDPNVEGKRVVRFFLQLPDRNMIEQLSNVVRALLDVEIVKAQPPKRQYRRCVDLELARDYAVPVCHLTEKPSINLIDRIVAALGGSGAALEIVARGDSKAAAGIQKWIYDKTHHGPSMSKAFSDIGVGVVAEATVQRYPRDISREAWWKYGRQYKTDPWGKEEIKEAETKLHRSLFTCNVRIYGNSPENIQTIKDALPSAMNRFRAFKTERKVVEVQNELEKPSRYWFRNNLLCRLWWATPLAVLFLSWFMGLFNPLRMISSPSSLSADMVVLTISIFSAFPLYWMFRKRHPIVLSTDELAQIVGLPSAIGKLPVALGRVPTARMQLGGEWAVPPALEEEQKNETSGENDERGESGGEEVVEGRLPADYNASQEG